jgi:hypothetical protein
MIADINSFPARQRDSFQRMRAPRGEFEHFHSLSRIMFFDEAVLRPPVDPTSRAFSGKVKSGPPCGSAHKIRVSIAASTETAADSRAAATRRYFGG